MTISRVLTATALCCFVAFAWLYVPRLTNCLWSDNEFTGWVGPIAKRLADGERIYNDFTLPISIGSFSIMERWQKLSGRFRLMDELWFCMICQFAMVIAGYYLVRPFTSRLNASLVLLGSIPLLISAPKEIVYDHTALLVAWTSLAVMAHGLVRTTEKSRRILLGISGFLAGFTLSFKSSTGVGAIGGTCFALGMVAWISRREHRRSWFRLFLKDLAALGIGTAASAVVGVAWLIVYGADIMEFFRVVFIDGPKLKGGTVAALGNLTSYFAIQSPVFLSLLSSCVIVYGFVKAYTYSLSFQMLSRHDDAELMGTTKLGITTAIGLFYIVAVFGLACLFLIGNAKWLPDILRVGASVGHSTALIGLFLLLFLIGINYAIASHRTQPAAAFVAIAAAAGIVSLTHNLSIPNLRPLFDNNPIIPLVVFAWLHFADSARSYIIKYGALACILLTLMGPKFERFLEARHKVIDNGFWHGMLVSKQGLEVLQAAKRIRQLTSPHDTVFVLPECPMLSALIDRPRPKLKGAIVFVDQYPKRVLQQDLLTLHSHPPKVLVLHPDSSDLYKQIYGFWSHNSPAATLQQRVVSKPFRNQYTQDSRYPTRFFRSDTHMSVLVRTP